MNVVDEETDDTDSSSTLNQSSSESDIETYPWKNNKLDF